MTRVDIENGKYTFIVQDGRIDVMRHGEAWIGDWNGPGGKAVIGLIHEVERLRRALPPKPTNTRMTSYPVWYILDPSKVHADLRLQHGVFGVWFDQDSAEAALAAGTEEGEYSAQAYVYCGSGYRSEDWKRVYDARPDREVRGRTEHLAYLDDAQDFVPQHEAPLADLIAGAAEAEALVDAGEIDIEELEAAALRPEPKGHVYDFRRYLPDDASLEGYDPADPLPFERQQVLAELQEAGFEGVECLRVDHVDVEAAGGGWVCVRVRFPEPVSVRQIQEQAFDVGGMAGFFQTVPETLPAPGEGVRLVTFRGITDTSPPTFTLREVHGKPRYKHPDGLGPPSALLVAVILGKRLCLDAAVDPTFNPGDDYPDVGSMRFEGWAQPEQDGIYLVTFRLLGVYYEHTGESDVEIEDEWRPLSTDELDDLESAGFDNWLGEEARAWDEYIQAWPCGWCGRPWSDHSREPYRIVGGEVPCPSSEAS